MTKFHNGPANGQTLMIRRTPFLLRVTVKNDDKGKPVFDALDQPGDKPEAGETLMAYRCSKLRGHIHLNTGRKPGGGFYPLADYEFIPMQPPQALMHSEERWKQWCEQPQWKAEYERQQEINASSEGEQTPLGQELPFSRDPKLT